MSERPHKHVGQRLGRGGRASRDGSARAPDRGNATEGQQLPPGSINGLPGTQGSYPSVQFGSFTGLPGAELQQSPGSGFQMNALGFQSVMRTTSAPPSMADMVARLEAEPQHTAMFIPDKTRRADTGVSGQREAPLPAARAPASQAGLQGQQGRQSGASQPAQPVSHVRQPASAAQQLPPHQQPHSQPVQFGQAPLQGHMNFVPPQGAYPAGPGGYPFYPYAPANNFQAGVSYSASPPGLPAGFAPPQPYTAPARQPAAKSKAIKIIDPATNQEVMLGKQAEAKRIASEQKRAAASAAAGGLGGSKLSGALPASQPKPLSITAPSAAKAPPQPEPRGPAPSPAPAPLPAPVKAPVTAVAANHPPAASAGGSPGLPAATAAVKPMRTDSVSAAKPSGPIPPATPSPPHAAAAPPPTPAPALITSKAQSQPSAGPADVASSVSGVSGATSAPFAAPSSFIKTMSWAKVASQPSSDADKPQVEEAKPIGIRTPAAVLEPAATEPLALKAAAPSPASVPAAATPGQQPAGQAPAQPTQATSATADQRPLGAAACAGTADADAGKGDAAKPAAAAPAPTPSAQPSAKGQPAVPAQPSQKPMQTAAPGSANQPAPGGVENQVGKLAAPAVADAGKGDAPKPAAAAPAPTPSAQPSAKGQPAVPAQPSQTLRPMQAAAPGAAKQPAPGGVENQVGKLAAPAVVSGQVAAAIVPKENRTAAGAGAAPKADAPATASGAPQPAAKESRTAAPTAPASMESKVPAGQPRSPSEAAAPVKAEVEASSKPHAAASAVPVSQPANTSRSETALAPAVASAEGPSPANAATASATSASAPAESHNPDNAAIVAPTAAVSTSSAKPTAATSSSMTAPAAGPAATPVAAGSEAAQAGAAGEGSEEAGRAAPALSAKAKRKAALERAEAASGQGDFMDAYTEHKEAPPEPAAKAAPLAPPPSTAQTTPVDEEVDDWETAAEGVPTPRAKAPHAPADDTKRLQYSRDWLMTFQSACIRKPEGLEQGETSMILRDGSGDGGRQAFDMAPRRAPPRAGPPPPPADADSRWKNRGMPMAGPGGPPGMPGMMGPGGRMMGTGRGLAGKQGIEGDKWQRGPLPPAPPGGGARAPVLHKSENRYEVGKVLSDDPDEERKQKEIKSLLNKVTPEKFDKIFDQMVAVGIATPKTLRGLINQVFDKALTEPTFCEIYAKLCLKLNEELPDFEDDTEVEPEDGRPRQPLTLRRLLLNKCQEEFEKGDAAMAAVDAREKADREKSEAQDQKAGEEGKEASTSGTDAAPGAAGEGEKEEGELAADDKLRLRREEALRAEEELKGRRRMLGNIQFIGQLYKYKMLTEKIMHTCIRKLLGEIDNPKREDVECLCKLLSTVGRQLDESKTGKGQGRQHMDAYFQRIQRLAQSPKLDSRIRFMLQDTIELRHAQWVERRKVEGPKTIEEIHADARNELNKQRLQGGDRRGPRETFPPRGREPPPARRFDDSKVDAPIRTMRSNTDFAGSLRPGGGGAPSFRPGGGPPAVRAAQPSQRESLSTAAAPAARVPSPAPVPAAHPAAAAQPALTDQQLLTRAKTIIAELAANKNLKDADICIRELAEQAGNVVRLVEKVVQAVLEAKAVDLHSFSDVLVQLVQSAEALLSAAELQKGLEAVVDTLDQVAIDVPKAPGVMGELVGLLAGAGLVDLVGLARRALSAGRTQEGDAEEEEGGLVDDGYAVDLVGRALQTQAAQLGQDTMLKCWQAGGLDFIAFLPEYERDDDKALQKIAQKYSLRKLLKLPSPEEHVASAIAQGTSAEELRAWIDSNAKGSWSDPAFVRAIILSTLQTAVPAPQATDLSKSFRTGNATLERCLPLLQQLSNQNSPRTVQEAAVLAAQDYFEASNCLKGLMVRLLEDLRDWGLVSAPAFAHWQYDSKSQRAVMDAHRFLDEIKHQEAEEEET